jgi:hypothetical protein
LTLGTLSQATGADHQTLVERLKSLYAQERILLNKYVGVVRHDYLELQAEPADFFYKGSFLAEIVPQARAYFERLEQEAEGESQESLIFISCGQYSMKEIELGKNLAAAVDSLPGYKGYFAENQNSLVGLSAHIFRALDQCAGFVAVMHHRGEVETLGANKHIRGSIWIEQEIAIAAFLTATRNRDIPVLLYIEKGIRREGVREQLKLNPIEFSEEAEVLTDFRGRLKNGTFKTLPHAPQVSNRGEQRRMRGEELYGLVSQWLNRLGNYYLRRSGVMSDKLTYNQCLDLDIAEGKVPFDFNRIELLIDVDFPATRDLYDKIIVERTKLNKIESAFKRCYEEGENKGDEFLVRYVEIQRSIEALGEALQKQILECIRATET